MTRRAAWTLGALATVASLAAAAIESAAGRPVETVPSTAVPGQTVRLGLPSLKELAALPVAISAAGGPPLLLSDQPEVFPKDGLALREDVAPGPVRVYLYHLPSSDGKRIAAVVENRSDAAMTLRWRRYAFPQPSGDYNRIGKLGLIGYLGGPAPSEPRVVPPRARVVLDPLLDATPIVKGELAHGFYEFEVDQPARVYVLQHAAAQSAVTALGAAEVLHVKKTPGQADGAGRGKFPDADFKAAAGPYDTSDGPRRLIVADGKNDPWIAGRDGLDDVASVDQGNYGAIYHIVLSHASTDGRALALVVVNSRFGDEYCDKQAGAVLVGGKLVKVPADRPALGAFPEGVLLAKLPPVPKGQQEKVELVYSPPGASCLPTPILLVPYAP